MKIVVMNQIRVLIEAACDKKKVLQTIQQKMAKPGSVNHVQRNIIRLSEREQELDELMSIMLTSSLMLRNIRTK